MDGDISKNNRKPDLFHAIDRTFEVLARYRFPLHPATRHAPTGPPPSARTPSLLPCQGRNETDDFESETKAVGPERNY